MGALRCLIFWVYYNVTSQNEMYKFLKTNEGVNISGIGC